MIKAFPIDFITQTLNKILLEERIKDDYYFGGEDIIKLVSFYEQVRSNEEVDRFVEFYKDIIQQQNQTNLVGLGICTTTENPTITNVYNATIVPMTWNCSVRCLLENRDRMNDTINNVIEQLKGRKVDIAQLKCRDNHNGFAYVPFKVGTIGYGGEVVCGDYIGHQLTPLVEINIEDILTDLYTDYGIIDNTDFGEYLYASKGSQLLVYEKQPLEVDIQSTLAYQYEENVVQDTHITTFTFTMTSTEDYEELPDTNTYESDDIKIKVFDAYGRYYEQTYKLTNGVGEIVNNKLVVTFQLILSLPLSYFNDWSSVDYEVNEEDNVTYVLYYDNSEATWVKIENDGKHPNVIFPPEHVDFERYKISFSCDSTRCDTPFTLDGKQYINISFSGSATIVNSSVKLGNDLAYITLKKDKILGSPNISLSDSTYYLDPLEMGSGINASVLPLRLNGNEFKENTQSESTAVQIKYSFILNEDIDILKQLFVYSRYGTYQIDNSYDKTISPNMIFKLAEYFCSWGKVDKYAYNVKIVDTVDSDNTESDVLTVSVTFQIQGDENYGNDL